MIDTTHTVLSDHWFILYPLICYCFSLVYFLFQLLYSLALIGSFYIFCIFVQVLTEFIHFSSKFIEHLYDHYFELLSRSLISVLFSSLSEFFFFLFFHWNIFHCLLILSDSLWSATFPVPEGSDLIWQASCGAQKCNPSWSPEPGTPGVSPVWATCALPLCLGCNCCEHAGEWGWPLL